MLWPLILPVPDIFSTDLLVQYGRSLACLVTGILKQLFSSRVYWYLILLEVFFGPLHEKMACQGVPPVCHASQHETCAPRFVSAQVYTYYHAFLSTAGIVLQPLPISLTVTRNWTFTLTLYLCLSWFVSAMSSSSFLQYNTRAISFSSGCTCTFP